MSCDIFNYPYLFSVTAGYNRPPHALNQPVYRQIGLCGFTWTSMNRVTVWIRLTLNQMESLVFSGACCVVGSTPYSYRKPCTAVSLPEQRCQNNLVPHFGAACSLTTFRDSDIIVFIAAFTCWQIYTQSSDYHCSYSQKHLFLLLHYEWEWYYIFKI